MIAYIANRSERILSEIMNCFRGRNDIETVCFLDDKEMVLSIAQKGTPDVLILDPTMRTNNDSGILSLLPGIKTDNDFPVLATLDWHHRNAANSYLKSGADDVLIIPFSAEDLLIRIEKLVKYYARLNSLQTEILSLHRTTKNLQKENIVSICRMIEAKDDYTGDHIDRVGKLSYEIAIKSGKDAKKASMLADAAKLHDIGKIALPDEILKKPGELTQEEFEIIKTHTTKGHQIIEDCAANDVMSYAKDIVLTHHERWDGSGYPYGLKGNEIPMAGRIVAVADVFDALTFKRIYKKAWPVEKAIAYIKNQQGKQFDPDVVRAFLDVMNMGDHAKAVESKRNQSTLTASAR